LIFLSACSSLRPSARFSTPTPLPTLDPLPTPIDKQSYTLLPTSSEEAAAPEATVVPINVVFPESNTNCLTPIVAPTSAPVPPVGGVDPTTGRNVMGFVQVLDVQSYRLAVTGLVDQPLSLTYNDLRCMPKMTEKVTTTCYNFQATATWSGVLISEVLKKAGVQPNAKKVTQNAADGAKISVPLDMAMDEHNFLATQMGSEPIPILFGFPVRSIFINVAGQYSVKWLTSLEVS
jgi:DMSO/TMAO reductase YedYZ molybdopterin-dependent catalytic subunit